MEISKVARRFREIGSILFEKGLVDLRGGNISVRSGNNLIIKKTGRPLPFITSKDVISLPIYNTTSKDSIASTDLEIHRKIYIYADKAQERVNAVLHSHIPSAVALSFFLDKFTPDDYEGKKIIPFVPFVDYDLVPEYCVKYNICVVKGHGVFAVGKDLDEALSFTLTLSHSLKITYLKSILQDVL